MSLILKAELKAPRGAPLSAGGALPLQKNVGADSISARARLRQDKPPRAHIECAPTDFVFNIGFAGSGRYNKKRVCDI